MHRVWTASVGLGAVASPLRHAPGRRAREWVRRFCVRAGQSLCPKTKVVRHGVLVPESCSGQTRGAAREHSFRSCANIHTSFLPARAGDHATNATSRVIPSKHTGTNGQECILDKCRSPVRFHEAGSPVPPSKSSLNSRRPAPGRSFLDNLAYSGQH